MRHLYLTVILFSLLIALPQLNIKAQDYLPIPETNTSWIVRSGNSEYFGYADYFTINEDTLINSTTYHKVLFSDEDTDSVYSGAFRSNTNGKTYYVPKNTQLSQEYLLFDFTKNSGDTIKEVLFKNMPEFETYDLVVDSVDYLESGPYELKAMFMKLTPPYPSNYNGNNITWVESIGSLNGGIFNSYICGLNYRFLKCMDYSDTIRYNPWNPSCGYLSFDNFELTYDSGYCELPNNPSSIHEYDNSIGNNISISNPISDNLEITNLPSKKVIIYLYDSYGKLVAKEYVENSQKQKVNIQTNHLQSGVYLVILSSKKQIIYNQKIIKL